MIPDWFKNSVKKTPWLWNWIMPVYRGVNPVSREYARRNHYSDVVVGGEIAVLPSNLPGKFWMPARSHLAARVVDSGTYEPEISELLKKFDQSSDLVLNIGANIGFFAIHIAKTFTRASRVVAIEPSPEAFGYLKRNVAENGVSERIELVNMCVGASSEDVEFTVVAGMPEYSSVGGIVHGGVAGRATETLRVKQRRLSEIVQMGTVSFIFMDVEGAEHEVLKGAEELLRNHRPVILMECCSPMLEKFKSSSQQVLEYLGSLGYRCRNAESPDKPIVHPFDGNVIAEAK